MASTRMVCVAPPQPTGLLHSKHPLGQVIGGLKKQHPLGPFLAPGLPLPLPVSLSS